MQKPETITTHLNSVKSTSAIFCHHCGSKNYLKKGVARNKLKKQIYLCKDCGRRFVPNPDPKVSKTISNDVWDAAEMNLSLPSHRYRAKTIAFDNIEQDWLRDAAKKFVNYKQNTKQLSTILTYLNSLNQFSYFLAEHHSYVEFSGLNRSLIIDFIEYAKGTSKSNSSIQQYLNTLRDFLRTGIINNWFEVSPYLILEEDFPQHIQYLPRYIPEEVIQQLNEHLDELPEPIMRMVLVIQECGLRVGELCQLPLNCLKRDAKGDFYIQFIRWKMKKETTLPVSTELAVAIQEQQQFIRQHLEKEYNYLFCDRINPRNILLPKREFTPRPMVIQSSTFVRFLKRLAEEFDIKDSSGKPWNFQSHQFRHTVGTRMINNGVPQHIVQRYLGHESGSMTAIYAHVFDETLKREIGKYHDTRVVNITGEVMKSENPELDNDQNLQWMKRNILAQALPNGSCARPVVKGPCPHANACLTCGDFRTTIEFIEQHKKQVAQTEEIIEKAKVNNWQRQVEMNEQVKRNLNNIVNALEVGNE